MKLVLDTNIYSNFAEGIPETVDTLSLYGEVLLIPAVVLGELYYGFAQGRRQEYNERKLTEFITLFNVTIIHVDGDVARKYGLIFSFLKKKGNKIPGNDVWIAASCMSARRDPSDKRQPLSLCGPDRQNHPVTGRYSFGLYRINSD